MNAIGSGFEPTVDPAEIRTRKMYDETQEDEERRIFCGVCGTEIKPREMCYEIRYGIMMNTRFEPQEPYMVVHSHCLKE